MSLAVQSSSAEARVWGQHSTRQVSFRGSLAYAAPTMGSWFYYIPMWSILPGFYAKYGGLSLGTIATCLLLIRLFDGFTDTSIGYLADWHRSAGGTRKPWTVAGGIASIVACYFLFSPPHPASAAYYLVWSLLYFIAFTMSEIPHLAWGSELTLDYQDRSRVYGVRNVLARLGTLTFYALPLLPLYSTTDYTPVVLRDAVGVGAVLTLLGITIAALVAPVGTPAELLHKDSLRLLRASFLHNKPLLLYLVTFACSGLYCGMWYGLLYVYLDSYLALGAKVPLIFMIATVIGVFSTPIWLRLIRQIGKPNTWAVCAALFFLQLVGTAFLGPHSSWWATLALVGVANLTFNCNDIAAIALLGDVVDYGTLKFKKSRGATYFAASILIFKIGLGIGGGVGLGTAALFGYDAARADHTSLAIHGLKLGFVALPACFAFLTFLLILRSPIDRSRHDVIRRRLQSRLARAEHKT